MCDWCGAMIMLTWFAGVRFVTVAAYVHMASKKDGVHSVKLSSDMLITPTHGSGSMSTRKRVRAAHERTCCAFPTLGIIDFVYVIKTNARPKAREIDVTRSRGVRIKRARVYAGKDGLN